MTRTAWVLPLLPFVSALVGLGLAIRGPAARRVAAIVAALGTGSAAVLAIPLAAGAVRLAGPVQAAVEIAPTGGALTVSASTLVDPLAGIVALMVCWVALAVQLYSVEYLGTDARYPTFAAEVSLFTAAMLAVVLSGDLLALLIGWEVMGLCSYLLIGHYRELPEAPPAALKAFLVTRVGDVGFLLGVLLLGRHAHTFRITEVLAAVPSLSPGVLTAATLLIALGVAGKSAQFPLHTWLPDAMAGPTPISALIHAATMVAAGIYVVLRLHPAFAAAPTTLGVLAVVAAVTMVLGGLAALGQDDIKRVLAWSTVSQLAYMLGAAAVGAVTASAFHLLTHAAFKALLFLAAGAVLHGAGTGSMSRLGGLRHRMPVTFWVTVVGALALAGVPPASGAFSKESVLDGAYAAAHGEVPGVAPWTGWLVLAAGLLTVLLTAAYLTRLLLRTFLGVAREPAAAGAAHEPGRLMSWPVLALAVAAAGLGVLTGPLPRWLGGSLRLDAGLTVVSLLLVATGAGVTYLQWRADPAADPIRRLGPRLTAALAAGLYVDRAQQALVVRPVQAVARLASTADREVVDGAVRGTGRATVRLGRLLARAQLPDVQRYATGVVVGSILVAVAVVVTR
ncbi:MAG: NADH-quinone oxidoreductase subunit L [Actinobacteria bacterium]|nr:NADH-quinone oxidoreductase subunit L [Actinomycetota bacterium]